LDIGDYDHETGKMIIRRKRQKERTAYLQNGAGRALNDWLNFEEPQKEHYSSPSIKEGKLLIDE
jgi:integrase